MARRKRYSAEFKRQALQRADEPGMTDALVCEELGFSTRQLRRWREAIAKHGDDDNKNIVERKGVATRCRRLLPAFSLGKQRLTRS
jgi:transposase-like protein